MVFHKVKIRVKTLNVAEINEEKVGAVVKITLWVVTTSAVRFRDSFDLLPRWDL